jgi:hypothetical protein
VRKPKYEKNTPNVIYTTGGTTYIEIEDGPEVMIDPEVLGYCRDYYWQGQQVGPVYFVYYVDLSGSHPKVVSIDEHLFKAQTTTRH